jgi:hypothetical protein
MKPFSIYFPQYYPTQTNNNAWGNGFTDWSLVANANMCERWVRRAPERGFYDGASSDVHLAQIDEMVKFGLGGLAVYHYWFFTHQELDAFEKTMLSNRTNFPWFMIWASEGWSKRWLGDTTSIIQLAKSPTNENIENHCDYLEICFAHSDYMKVDGRPLFVFYNLSHFEDPENLVSRYRATMERRGINICLGYFIKNPFDVVYAPLVDVCYLFEPRLFFGHQRPDRTKAAKNIHDVFERLLSEKNMAHLLLFMDRIKSQGTQYSADLFLSYFRSEHRAELLKSLQRPVQDVLSPGWNNTPRYAEKFTALGNIDADEFASLLVDSTKRCGLLPPLVNAWNEWSEGAAIEPCAYFGTRYLDSISRSFSHVPQPNVQTAE